MPYWKKEEACFTNEKTITGDQWPRNKPPEQKEYEGWLADVVNPLTKEYYEFKLENGEIKKAQYKINCIVRLRQYDDSEKLVSKGNLIGYTALGDERSCPCYHPEVWKKTEFNHSTTVDPKNPNRLTTKTDGPKPIQEVYEMEWNEENLNKLLEQRENNHIELIVKEASSEKAVKVEPQATDKKTIELFQKPFDYLYSGGYVDEEQKKQNRAVAEKQGLAEQLVKQRG
jgi:hypothetical protein